MEAELFDPRCDADGADGGESVEGAVHLMQLGTYPFDYLEDGGVFGFQVGPVNN